MFTSLAADDGVEGSGLDIGMIVANRAHIKINHLEILFFSMWQSPTNFFTNLPYGEFLGCAAIYCYLLEVSVIFDISRHKIMQTET